MDGRPPRVRASNEEGPSEHRTTSDDRVQEDGGRRRKVGEGQQVSIAVLCIVLPWWQSGRHRHKLAPAHGVYIDSWAAVCRQRQRKGALALACRTPSVDGLEMSLRAE